MTSSAHEYDHPVSAAKTAAPGEPSDAQSMPPVPAVLTEGLSLVHGDRLALGDVSIRIEPGQTVALIGPNGSGKSTLMNAIAGLHRPRTGRIEVFGHLPGEVPVAYVFQATHVPAHLPLTVREVVRMGRYRHSGLIGRIGNDGKEIVSRSISRLGLDDLVARQLQELSGGQRQRVLVAQGLASQSDLLMLDEPMTGLDPMARDRIISIIKEEAGAGRTVIFSTHDMSEAHLADQVVLLAGRLIAAGSPTHALADENLARAYKAQLIGAGSHSHGVIDDAHHHDVHHHHEEHGHLH